MSELKITKRLSLATWKPTDTAYIAGIIDGEGCIGIYRRWNCGYFVQLTITNTDRELLDWLSKMFHANAVKRLYDKRPKNKLAFAVTLDRNRAYQVIHRVYPYLKIKKKQARLAIRFKEWQNAHKIGRTGLGHRAYGVEEHHRCEEFVQQSKALNRKGVA